MVEMSTNPHTFAFQCPHCDKQITVDSAISHSKETSLSTGIVSVAVHPIDPLQCPECGKYINLQLSQLDIEFEATPLITV